MAAPTTWLCGPADDDTRIAYFLIQFIKILAYFMRSNN